jgi:hypothetical protein
VSCALVCVLDHSLGRHGKVVVLQMQVVHLIAKIGRTLAMEYAPCCSMKFCPWFLANSS